MFGNSAFAESAGGSVCIDPDGELGLEAYAVQQLVDFMYTGRIDINGARAVRRDVRLVPGREGDRSGLRRARSRGRGRQVL
jgi:hypothetical protein